MAPPPPPPPPPPPICLPFFGQKTKTKKRLSFSSADPRYLRPDESRASYSTDSASYDSRSGNRNQPPPDAQYPVFQEKLKRNDSYSTSSTLTSAPEKLSFRTDSENYDAVPKELPDLYRGNSKKSSSKNRAGADLTRSNTVNGTKKSTLSSKWGYGWGIGKKDLQRGVSQKSYKDGTSPPSQPHEPTYQLPSGPPTRSNTRSTQASKSTQHTKSTQHSRSTHRSHRSHTGTVLNRPPIRPNESSSTLIGSAYERKINDVESIREVVDTTERLDELRKLMAKEDADYYIVPSEDAHGSEYVAASDKRREYISGFSGSAGVAIVTRTNAYLITDSRYWLQAEQQLDNNWRLVKAGAPGEPKDWIEWLVARANGSRIGIDGRMLSYEKASLLNSKLGPLNSKMIYPVQNLVDFVWRDKPPKSTQPVFFQPRQFAGEEAASKLAKLREWIRAQPPDVPSYSKTEPKPAQYQVGIMLAALDGIAYLLNLRGSDIPFNPLFHAYLFVGLDNATLFLEQSKVNEEIEDYLNSLGVERKPYGDVWSFLRRREWGVGKVIISPQTSYTISLVLSHFRTTVLPSHVDAMLSIKNEVEIEGLKRAYLRDGVAFVQFLAWLEEKLLVKGYDITEYEAGQRLTEFRRQQKYFMGLAYENISASGPNAALPHYSPRKSTARMIDRDLPYLNDSGGQYRDGTCDTTRTVHFGRPNGEQCEAYTKVLQGHIAIDSAVFPEGTSGRQLDVLARKALWKEGMNYMHGTGHGFGSFLTVHEGSHGFSSDVALAPGHVVTNEPGYYVPGKWGVRIESALVVRRVTTKHEFNGSIWLAFERLTCVPIQTRMVKESMLTKEEKSWLKDHNSRCYDKLAPYLKDDKRALKWLKREAERGVGLAGPVAGGLTVEWD